MHQNIKPTFIYGNGITLCTPQPTDFKAAPAEG